jgi:hypothetical protein
MFAEYPTVEFQEGLPNVDQFDGRQRVLLIIDDLMNKADQNYATCLQTVASQKRVGGVYHAKSIAQK